MHVEISNLTKSFKVTKMVSTILQQAERAQIRGHILWYLLWEFTVFDSRIGFCIVNGNLV